MNIRAIHLKETDSTNRWLADYTPASGEDMTVVVADYQTAGKGQGTNTWESEVGKNLLFSILIHPTMVPVARQFLLSEMGAVAIKSVLEKYTDGITLKWPNDVYWKDKKLCGTLIQTSIAQHHIKNCIFGIGLNVNQLEFSADLPNPVSMRQITRLELDCREVLERVAEKLMARYEMLRRGEEQQLQADYHELLYRRDALHWYFLPDGKAFRGTIRGVEPSGALIVENEKGEQRSYLFKEIEFSVKNITK
jgi:BirA family biotin operon repressor/biotin-[acetyl-CoA-carboxylase] ligase